MPKLEIVLDAATRTRLDRLRGELTREELAVTLLKRGLEAAEEDAAGRLSAASARLLDP